MMLLTMGLSRSFAVLTSESALNFSTQVGSQPLTSVAWLPTLRVLVTLSKDGTLQMWKTRVILNPNRPPTQANFFEPAGKFSCASSITS